MSSFVEEPESLTETDEELNRGLETIRQLVAEYESIVRDTDELNETQEARVREIQSIMMSAPMIKVQRLRRAEASKSRCRKSSISDQESCCRLQYKVDLYSG